MRIKDVPQDPGIINDQRREICYAQDDQGKYVLAGSAGWEPKTIANRQAWDLIDNAAAAALEKVHRGLASPLAYHMARHQMGIGLLATYADVNRLRVWRHLKPGPFSRLKRPVLQRYADAFDISVGELKSVPDTYRSRSGMTTA